MCVCDEGLHNEWDDMVLLLRAYASRCLLQAGAVRKVQTCTCWEEQQERRAERRKGRGKKGEGKGSCSSVNLGIMVLGGRKGPW